jgi:DMSO/TMAO reductase YedYZ molybdopterin-dependent catalytic subunit
VAWSHSGYTTNLPLADVTDGKAWAWEVNGEALPASTAAQRAS